MAFLLHAGATVQCSHAGRAQAATPNPSVKVANQATVAISGAWTIAGCSLPTNAGGPCVSAQFTTAATRITSHGQPLLLSDSQATCMPTGVPLQVVVTQTRVKGQ
jgi:hypothetical protein